MSPLCSPPTAITPNSPVSLYSRSNLLSLFASSTTRHKTDNCWRNFKAKMSSPSAQAPSDSSPPLPPLPENPTVLGCGGLSMDLLAAVEAYPKPDDKIRSTSLKIQGGGNVGNGLTCAARLGLKPRLISKIADDAQGRGILEELEADGIDTSFLVVSKEGNSPFTYVIVDNQTKTRTCIHTPGFPPMIPDDVSKSSLFSALDGVGLAYFDARLPATALVVGHEVVVIESLPIQAKCRSIPILIDAERKREGLDDLLHLSDYIVCSAKFPQASKLNHSNKLLPAWTEASSVPSALLSMLLRLPNVKFVIVTLGGDGCIMLQRSVTEGDQSEEMDVDNLLESLNQRKDSNTAIPTCISSAETKLRANGIGTVSGRLFIGTAENIPPSELVDTTGAGDAFIGAILYAERYPATFADHPLSSQTTLGRHRAPTSVILTTSNLRRPSKHTRQSSAIFGNTLNSLLRPLLYALVKQSCFLSEIIGYDKLRQNFMFYLFALACNQKKCSHLPPKWQLVVVEHWELELVFLIAQIHDWPLFYDKRPEQ
ncbi:hypothetical protein RHSIM_Rhsim01G0259300 [Rhododendron simsii]|uniref:Carbohydrate kinase PfkB domain-containing protein n=1 Tax=Rhododendron simsii TaxID=118357 RepID=A0A834HFT2_RHOSS|nr:hypothetical protein RHSIM_Rhsim01G0259300 [Rhododendron simsii]